MSGQVEQNSLPQKRNIHEKTNKIHPGKSDSCLNLLQLSLKKFKCVNFAIGVFLVKNSLRTMLLIEIDNEVEC